MAVVVLIVAAVCVRIVFRGSKSSTPPSDSGTADAHEVKTPLLGLIDRQGQPAANMLAAVKTFVVKVNWADLQPVAGGPIQPGNAIDAALAKVRDPAMASQGVQLKLRVFAGVGAPEWAKHLGGDPIEIMNGQDESKLDSGTIGRFWREDFGHAYGDLQTKLAAKYDGVPEIHEITVSRCTTLFDEPFVRQASAGNNRQNLLQAGYTLALDKKCEQQEIDTHKVWKTTISDVDFNPFRSVENPNAPADEAYTESMMRYCRQILGPRCGLQNNSLSSSKISDPGYQAMYSYMKSLGGPIMLQTATVARIGDWRQTLGYAVQMGAVSVEVPQGYDKPPPAGWPIGELTTFASQLAANWHG